MDIFSSMLGDDENTQLKKKVWTCVPLVKRDGLVVKLHKASLLFFDDKAQTEVFIPFSQIRDLWYTGCTGKLKVQIHELDPDDEITVVIPEWLAKKEGLE